jgi:hypothetical protein
MGEADLGRIHIPTREERVKNFQALHRFSWFLTYSPESTSWMLSQKFSLY